MILPFFFLGGLNQNEGFGKYVSPYFGILTDVENIIFLKWYFENNINRKYLYI